MHVMMTISLATAATIFLIGWAMFALIRAHFRRQRRIRRELKEMKRLERKQRIAGRFKALIGGRT